MALVTSTFLEDVSLDSETRIISTAGLFDFSAIFGSIIRFDVNGPGRTSGSAPLFVELFDDTRSATVTTPNTINNFLDYVDQDLYDNTIFHRNIPGFVLQGGGFTTPTAQAGQPGGAPQPIPKNAPVINEPGNPNVRGTIAMAKLAGDPNSATSQFFFNLQDNSQNLDNQNGGFTSFGQLLGDSEFVVDFLASQPTFITQPDYFNYPSFNDLPLYQVDTDQLVKPADFISILDVNLLSSEDQLLEFSVSSSNPSALEASINSGGNITLKSLNYTPEPVQITLTAESIISGERLQQTFTASNLTAGLQEGQVVVQDTKLSQNTFGYVIQSNETLKQITYTGGVASDSNPGTGWVGLAATPDADGSNGFDLYWENPASNQYALWNLDSSGTLLTGSVLSKEEFLDSETRLQSDLDQDGITGVTFNPSFTIEDNLLNPELNNAVSFGSTQLGYAIQNGDNAPLHIKFAGGFTSDSNPGAGWVGLAATPDADGSNGFDLYWENPASNQYALWNLDSSGTLLTGSLLSKEEFLDSETRLQSDLDQDGITGVTFNPSFTIEDNLLNPELNNAVSFGSTQLGYAIQNGDNAPLHIKFAGGFTSDSNPGTGWVGLAATPDADGSNGFDLYWENPASNQYALWNLDSSGTLLTGSVLSKEEFLDSETRLQSDLDQDGITGVTFNPSFTIEDNLLNPELNNAVSFGSTQLGYAIQNGDNAPLHIKFAGGFTSDSNPGTGWVGLAATPDADGSNGFDLYWENPASNQYALWNLDSSGTLLTGSVLSKEEFLDSETRLQSDLDQDGITGVTFNPSFTIEDNLLNPELNNAVSFGSTQLGYAIQNGDNAPLHIKFAGGFTSDSNPGTGWVGLAATPDADGSNGFDLYWENPASNQYALWNLDSSGTLLTGSLLSKEEFLDSETRLQSDLDQDGITGVTFNPSFTIEDNLLNPELNNAVSFGSTQLGYAIQNGDNAPLHIKFAGGFTSDSNPGAGWVGLAATPDADGSNGFDLYWENPASNQYALWNLDSSGTLLTGSLLSKEDFAQIEQIWGDINSDGQLGSLPLI